MKSLFKITFFILLTLSCTRYQIPELKNGDIIFHISKSKQSEAIQIATNSKYSHIGIVFIDDGIYYVCEAVQPVKLTKLDNWIKRGENEHFVVKRLKRAKDIFTQEKINKMEQIIDGYLGKNYDLYFEWSDDKLYCSELVWKIYKHAFGIELTELGKMEDFNLSHPIVISLMEERFGSDVPLDEMVVSPSDIFNSPLLETVFSN